MQIQNVVTSQRAFIYAYMCMQNLCFWALFSVKWVWSMAHRIPEHQESKKWASLKKAVLYIFMHLGGRLLGGGGGGDQNKKPHQTNWKESTYTILREFFSLVALGIFLLPQGPHNLSTKTTVSIMHIRSRWNIGRGELLQKTWRLWLTSRTRTTAVAV